MKSALVVEDELIVALDLKRILMNNGFQKVRISSNARDAIKKVAEEHFDLITLDIMLHGLISGIDAAREIRRMTTSKIIFICGNHPSMFSNRYLDYADGYALKPFMEAELIRTVNSAIAV